MESIGKFIEENAYAWFITCVILFVFCIKAIDKLQKEEEEESWAEFLANVDSQGKQNQKLTSENEKLKKDILAERQKVTNLSVQRNPQNVFDQEIEVTEDVSETNFNQN